MRGGTTLKVKSANSKGYEEATEGDSINIAYPQSGTRRGRVGKQISNTILTSPENAVVVRGKATTFSGNKSEIIIFDDYNGRVREDQNSTGTITTNMGTTAPRNGTKLIEIETVGDANRAGGGSISDKRSCRWYECNDIGFVWQDEFQRDVPRSPLRSDGSCGGVAGVMLFTSERFTGCPTSSASPTITTKGKNGVVEWMKGSKDATASDCSPTRRGKQKSNI